MNDLNHHDTAYDSLLSRDKVRRFSRNRKNKNGLVKIEIEILRYTYAGTNNYKKPRIYVDTGIWVKPGNWNNKTQKLSTKEDNYDYKSNRINQIFASVYAYVSTQGRQDLDQAYSNEIDFSKVRDLFPSRKENRKTFYDLMIDYKKYRKTDGDTAPDTVKTINTICNRVKHFDEHSKQKTYIENVNFNWSERFNAWMVGTKEYRPQTIDRTYQILRDCLKYYWKRKDELQLEMNDKFKDKEFSFGKKTSNKPKSLSFEQREILFNYRFDKPYLEKARKMMCIQAFTGCRYGDIKLFTPDNFKNEILTFTPKKTKRYDIVVVQPLHPNAKLLFEEVSFNTSNEYTTSNQKYDEYMKEVLQELKDKYPEAKFDTDFGSHNMRDTFISICVKKGVNFKSLLGWVGQRKYETLAVYIDLDEEFERSEMDKTVHPI